jgi:hypothetical protein
MLDNGCVAGGKHADVLRFVKRYSSLQQILKKGVHASADAAARNKVMRALHGSAR